MNKMKWRFHLLAVAACLFVAGCSTAGYVPAPGEQTGAVHSRSDSDGGGGGGSSM